MTRVEKSNSRQLLAETLWKNKAIMRAARFPVLHIWSWITFFKIRDLYTKHLRRIKIGGIRYIWSQKIHLFRLHHLQPATLQGLWKNLWNPSTLARAAVGGESIGFVEGFPTDPTGEPVVDDEARLLQVPTAAWHSWWGVQGSSWVEI